MWLPITLQYNLLICAYFYQRPSLSFLTKMLHAFQISPSRTARPVSLIPFNIESSPSVILHEEYKL
jgi:hypothetical protein